MTFDLWYKNMASGLVLYQTPNFCWLDLIENVCRRQNKWSFNDDLNDETLWKNEKKLVSKFFSKVFFVKALKPVKLFVVKKRVNSFSKDKF